MQDIVIGDVDAFVEVLRTNFDVIPFDYGHSVEYEPRNKYTGTYAVSVPKGLMGVLFVNGNESVFRTDPESWIALIYILLSSELDSIRLTSFRDGCDKVIDYDKRARPYRTALPKLVNEWETIDSYEAWKIYKDANRTEWDDIQDFFAELI